MTIDHWLAIAMIISTLTGPSMAEYFKPHKPRVKPDTNQPKNLIQRIKELYQSPWLLPLLIVGVNIFSLYRDTHLTGPITRKDIMRISLDCAAICFGCTIWFIFGLLKISRLSAEIALGHERSLIEHFAITREIVAAVFPDPPPDLPKDDSQT